MSTDTTRKVNVGVQTPIAKGDTLHGTFDKQTGELLEFSLTDTSCNVDYTKQLNKNEIELCKLELKRKYQQHVKSA